MGAKNTKMNDEVTALKAQILSMERRQSSAVHAAVKTTTQQLTLERERAVEEERARSDQLEEQRSVAQLQNELLTEMVAAEQVNVKLQERRNEALKWELLRQGGCQEKFDNIAKEVPDLADTLRADTADVLHGVAKHDMAEAIEHVVRGIGDVKEELHQAFLARDTGHTGALGGSAFKDALRESFPDMPREDRQLLMLRFIREVDQSVDYAEFLAFCAQKAESRERLRMGLTGALAATRSKGMFDTSLGRGAGGLASTMPVQGTPAQRPKPFFATALMLSRPSPPAPGLGTSHPFAGAGWGAGARRGTGRTDSVFTQGPIDPVMEAAVRTKVAAKIARQGAELEALLKARDPEGAGEIPVKAFSECLRSWDSSGNNGSGNHHHPAGGATRANEGGGPGSETLTHADRKSLYRRWTVKGWVRYDDFLMGNGYYDAHLPRYSDVSTAIPAAIAAAGGAVGGAPPAAAPAPAYRVGRRGNRSSLGSAGSGAGTGAAAAAAAPDKGERSKEREDAGRKLTARARVVLVHLSKVLQDDGEEAYFAAFEAHDGDNFRCVDEDGFVDAIETLAPEVTTERALDLFRARAELEEDDRADYDKLFKDLRKMVQSQGFQSGDTVELRVKRRGGGIDWLPAQVVSKDEDGTYTVRFRPTKVPGGGTRIKESGVPESDLREIVLLKPPSTRPSKSGGGGFLGTVASWWGGGSRNKAGKGKEGVPLSTRLTRLFGRGGGAESSPAKKQGKGRRSSLASRRKSASARRTSEAISPRRSRRNRTPNGSDGNSSSSSDGSSAYATEPERTPRRLSPTSTGGGGIGGGGEAGDTGLWSDEDEDEERDGVQRRASLSPSRSPSVPRSRSPSLSMSLSPSRSGSLPLSHSPSSSLSPARRRSERADSGGNRRMVELPVIQEGVSTLRGRTRRNSSGSRRAPAAGGSKRLSSGRGERRNSGGLKSLETLGKGSIEDKFDLYKKRTKNALSPETQRARGRSASASSGR